LERGWIRVCWESCVGDGGLGGGGKYGGMSFSGEEEEGKQAVREGRGAITNLRERGHGICHQTPSGRKPVGMGGGLDF